MTTKVGGDEFRDRPDHAAPVQRAVAEVEDTEEAWRRTGDLYFDWMEAMPETDRIALSAQSVEAYRKALEKAPGNMDVRADMAWALQYDPQNAMAAIQENQTVLQADPDHIQANYNRAVFLMRINRLDQAAEQFERVKQIVGPESPIYEQADGSDEAVKLLAGALRGAYADLLSHRFKQAERRLGLNRGLPPLDVTQFEPPKADSRQLSLL